MDQVCRGRQAAELTEKGNRQPRRGQIKIESRLVCKVAANRPSVGLRRATQGLYVNHCASGRRALGNLPNHALDSGKGIGQICLVDMQYPHPSPMATKPGQCKSLCEDTEAVNAGGGYGAGAGTAILKLAGTGIAIKQIVRPIDHSQEPVRQTICGRWNDVFGSSMRVVGEWTTNR